MTWKNIQLPLSSDEIRQILENCGEHAILIGGQALVLWSQVYHSQAHSALEERDVFPFVEEIRRIALNKKLARVYYEYGFDVLSVVPVDMFEDENFLSKRWPQIQTLVAEQRQSQAKLCSKYPPWPGGGAR
jgi:hypothetical protein